MASSLLNANERHCACSMRPRSASVSTPDGLRAAAQAALAAPDREITIEVGAQRLLGAGTKAA